MLWRHKQNLVSLYFKTAWNICKDKTHSRGVDIFDNDSHWINVLITEVDFLSEWYQQPKTYAHAIYKGLGNTLTHTRPEDSWERQADTLVIQLQERFPLRIRHHAAVRNFVHLDIWWFTGVTKKVRHNWSQRLYTKPHMYQIIHQW